MATVRIYSPYFPFPFHEAAFQTIFNQAHDLADMGHTVEMVTWKDNVTSIEKKRRSALSEWNPQIVHRLWQSESTSTLKRVARSFLTSEASPEIFYYPTAADDRDKLDVVDIEIYHYSFSYNWLRQNRGRGRKVFVHFHNLEHELFNLRAKVEGGPKAIVHRLNALKLLKHEAELANIADEIWQHSESDLIKYADYLGTKSQTVTQRTITPTISSKLLEPRWQSPLPKSDTYKLGFIGGLDFEPNRQSMRWIIDNLAPIIQKRSLNVEIIHVGKPDSELRELASKFEFVKFLGFVENIEGWWRELSWTMVPDFTGAGIRLKLLESLGSKIPVLATKGAATRLPRPLLEESYIFVSDSPDDWINEILSNPPTKSRHELRKRAFPPSLTGQVVYSFLPAARTHDDSNSSLS